MGAQQQFIGQNKAEPNSPNRDTVGSIRPGSAGMPQLSSSKVFPAKVIWLPLSWMSNFFDEGDLEWPLSSQFYSSLVSRLLMGPEMRFYVSGKMTAFFRVGPLFLSL